MSLIFWIGSKLGIPKGRVTRLGLYGGPRSLHGSFAGKSPATGPGISVLMYYYRKKKRRF